MSGNLTYHRTLLMVQALPPPTISGNFVLGLLDQGMVTTLRQQRLAQLPRGVHFLKLLACPPQQFQSRVGDILCFQDSRSTTV